MMHFKQLTIVIIVLLLSSCGGGSSNNPVSEDQSSITHSYTVNFPDNSAIAASSKIILIFDKTLDPSKVLVTGTMAGESDGGVWSANSSENDTLTVTPASNWTSGSNKTLVIKIKDAAGSVLQTISLNYTIDLIAPQVIDVTPTSASTIGGSQQIVITFDESMDVSSLSLSGSMQTKSDTGVWSSTGKNINDRLTLTPASSWNTGAGQTLTVDINDAVGNPLTSLSLGYVVDLSSPSVSSINAPNGTILLAAQPIIMVFDRTMDAASLALGSNMAAEAGTAVWSDTNSVNDTLTIPPATAWVVGYWENNDGIAQELTVNAKDIFGNLLPTLTLKYIVDVISVSNLGNDTLPGTMNQPMKTIQAALSKANSDGIKNIYIKAGYYSQYFDLVEGINIKGGFDSLWIFDDYNITDHKALITSSVKSVVTAKNLTVKTKIENLVLKGRVYSTRSDTPKSSYVIRVFDSNNLIINDVNIIAGKGESGNDGANGVLGSGPASNGKKGGNAGVLSISCNDLVSGAGGLGGVDINGMPSGGAGGNGGTVDTSCLNYDLSASDGQPGENASTYTNGIYGKGGNQGQGDTSGICDSSIIGAMGSVGARGKDGSNGLALGNPAGSVVAGFWVVSGHGDNGEIGSPGMGGGGGGGSGGCDYGIDKYGAGGGGGGAGGSGSTIPGRGGRAGGYSFGIFSSNASITMNNVRVNLGAGGQGGNGGKGASGRYGGYGGYGGVWVDGTSAGGRGGNAGKGGNSGAGGGGAGGSVYGIYSESSTITTNNTIFTGGVPGIGGNAPNRGVNGSVMNIGP